MTDLRDELRIFARLLARLFIPAATSFVLLSGTAAIEAGCLKAVPVIGPTVSCVSTIIADALKGMTLDDILKDAGPTCVQSIDQVIAILLGEAARNPMVKETLAYRDQRTVAALKAASP